MNLMYVVIQIDEFDRDYKEEVIAVVAPENLVKFQSTLPKSDGFRRYNVMTVPVCTTYVPKKDLMKSIKSKLTKEELSFLGVTNV